MTYVKESTYDSQNIIYTIRRIVCAAEGELSMRIITTITVILSFIVTVTAQISITGSIKNKAGNGISGADITLVSVSNVSAKSGIDGSFSITAASSIHRKIPLPMSYNVFKVKNSTIEFSSDLANKGYSLSIYALDGKMVLSKHSDKMKRAETIDCSVLDNGIYIIKLILDGKEYAFRYSNVQSFFTTGTYGNQSSQKKSALFKLTSVVDTLVVVKSGYVTKKMPLDSYTSKGIEVQLDTITQSGAKKGLTVYFIRHAETVANASGEQGGTGPLENHDTLTALGERQVLALRDYLIKENITPDRIIVSPAWRAQKTIEPYLSATNATAEIWVELNECCGQEPTGAPLPVERPEVKWKMKIEKASDLFTFRSSEDSYYWWPQTYEEGLFMIMTGRDRLLEQFNQSGKTVVIVGHAVNGGILLGLLQGYDMITTKPSRPVYILNTGVHKLMQDSISGAFSLKQNINNPATK
jgi:broad specificity phosphatase PhoE